MATPKEIEDCFRALNNLVDIQHAKEHGFKTGADQVEADTYKKLLDIGIFIGQSVVEDIKRIAEAQEKIADCAQYHARLAGYEF